MRVFEHPTANTLSFRISCTLIPCDVMLVYIIMVRQETHMLLQLVNAVKPWSLRRALDQKLGRAFKRYLVVVVNGALWTGWRRWGARRRGTAGRHGQRERRG